MADTVSRIRQVSLSNTGLQGTESLLAHYLRFVFELCVIHDYMLFAALLPGAQQQPLFDVLSTVADRVSSLNTMKERERRTL
jgi:hypothetical protein